MTTPFPHTMDFIGFNAPSRIEADVFDLVVHGEIPKEINGAWYRCIPDPQYPPRLGEDTFLSGDGMVGRFWFENGHVDYSQRYVKTERLEADRAARKSLFGSYRNPYTDDPAAKGIERGAANTTPIYHAGKLLALKEDSRAVELDPVTLETVGRYDYEGQLKSPTMTAHTRLDPDTGELFAFGYEAGGLASRDVAFWVVDKNGQLVREEWFEVPYCSLMHDFIVTKEHVLFPVFPTTADLDRLKSGGAHWIYEPDKPAHVGIMPRNGSVSDMRWFTYDANTASSFHFMNGFTEGELVHMDFGLSQVNPFPFIQKASGIEVDPATVRSNYVRWTFDLSKPDTAPEMTIKGPPGDFPRVADKDFMKDYEIGYYERFDPSRPPNIVGPVGAGFNTVSRLNMKTGDLKSLVMDERSTVQEHVHIPSSKPDHEGYLAFVVDLHDVMGSEIWIVEAERPEDGPIARIESPFRLRCQVHGNWVAADAF